MDVRLAPRYSAEEQHVQLRGFQCAVLFVLALRLCSAEAILRGRVEDENNAPVAGAAVSARPSDQASVSARPVPLETDVSGAFQLTVPESGSYLISVSKEGFFPLADRPLNISEAAPEVTLVLNHVRNTSESVYVSAAPSPIDVDETGAKSSLSGPQIFEVPYPSTHELRNALTILPGVVEGPAGDLHFDGGAENQVQYLLNGFNVNDPLTGTFNTHLAVDAVQSIDYLNSRYSPEYGKGSAGTLAIRTESGDDTWRYSGTNFVPGLDTSGGAHIGSYTPRVTFSGPIVKGRAWFSNTIDGNYNQLIVPDLPDGQNTRTSYGASDLLHTQVNVTPGNILVTDVLASFIDTPNFGLGALTPIPTTFDQRNRQWFFSAKDQIYLTKGTLLELGFADLRTFSRQIPQGQELYLFTINGNAGNYYIDSTQHSERKQFLANLFLPAFRWAGSHQLKAGIDVDRLYYSQDTFRTGFENVGLTGEVLRKVTFAGSGILSRPSLEAGSYIQDTWKIRANLVAEVGLREDWNELVRDTALSPRVSVSYLPSGLKNTKIAGGYAVIYDAVTPQLFSRPDDQYSLTTLYNPDGSLQSGPAATVFTFGPHLKMPRYQNWSLGVEQLLPARILLGVNLLRRRSQNGLTYVNVFDPHAPPPPDLAALYGTSSFESIYQLQNARKDIYDSVEVRLRQPFGKKYEWTASYTRSRAYSNAVVDVTVDQPMLISSDVGRLPWDSPNRFLSWGYLPTPFQNWAIAYLFEVRSGFPFSVVDPIGNVAGAPNSNRYPNYQSLNLHVEWTTHLLGYRFALRGGFNNITDHNNYTVVNNTAGAPNFLTFYGSTGRHFVLRIRWLGRVSGS
jgi:Carboxypeptidase regulatory-like domain